MSLTDLFCNYIWIPAIKFLERISQSVDFIALRKESVHEDFMAISKVIITCEASCMPADKLRNVNTI